MNRAGISNLSELAEACGKSNWLLTGRATTALYLLLASRAIRGRQIVLPVNICYSLVHAVTLSGNEPRFVDVDPTDGNVRCEHAQDVWSAEPAVLVAVHNLGNPNSDLPGLATLCRRHATILVEDCAAALGGASDGRLLGSTGDYSLFSFGAGKTVDAELGGLLVAAESLAAAEQLSARLPPFSERQREKTQLFTQLYRLVYHSSFYNELAEPLGKMREFFQDMYLFRLDESQQRQVAENLLHLPETIVQRRARSAWYDRELPFAEPLHRYPMAGGAVPWRYNVLVDDARLRQRLIDELLGAGIRVSRWYPPVHRLFGLGGDFPGAERFAQRILNWPLDDSPRDAQRTLDVVRAVMRSELGGT